MIQLMFQSNTLRRKLWTRSPNNCIAELCNQCSMKSMTSMFDCRITTQNNSISRALIKICNKYPQDNKIFTQIWCISRSLRIDANQRQIFPNATKQKVHVQIQFTANDNRMWIASNSIQFINAKQSTIKYPLDY